MSALPAFFDALAIIGGILLALCTLPQIVQMWRRKNADDVSILFIITYAVGIALTAAYLVYIKAWAAAALVETGMGVFMLISKLLIAARYPKTSEPLALSLFKPEANTGDASNTAQNTTQDLINLETNASIV